MKVRPTSSKSYYEVKDISDGVYAGTRDNFANDIIKLIKKYDTKLRPSPHIKWAITFSIPTQIKNSFVIGIRYKKQDNTFTEDHIMFQKGRNIRVFSKNELEKLLPEYKGSHKGEPDFIEYADKEAIISFE